MTPHPEYELLSGWSAHGNPANKSNQRLNVPPSPSTSGSVQQEAQRKCGHDIEDPPKSPLQELEGSSAHQDSQTRDLKRKRTGVGHQVRKRYKTNNSDTSNCICTGSHPEALERDNPPGSKPSSDSSELAEVDDTSIGPIQYWARNRRWPENFANMNQEQSASSKKRASSVSYTQRRKDGEVPEAYSPAYEKHLAEHGMIMEESAGRSHISAQSKLLCAQLLGGAHHEPQNTMYPISQFLSVWERAQTRNEARIFRDFTPFLVPSPELLFLSGKNPELEHVVEEISVEWTKCKTLGGPKPKPDFVVGLASSAFTEEEMAKLRNHASPERPTAFTDNLYFPFVLCEAKCGDQGIRRADRQNMHSSSLAVKAIVTLGENLGPEKRNALDGETLVYSISHDNERVKLYGHLVHKGTFHRYPIASFVLNFEENHGWKRTHDFFREVYRLVYPAHLKRIRETLASLSDPRNAAMISSMSFEEDVEESASQELDPNVPLENASFQMPGMPASKRQKSELLILQEQLAEQQKQNREQMLLLQRQMAEQADQHKEQADQYKEQINLLKQLLQRQ